MKIISLNYGKKKTYDFSGKIIESAFMKKPVFTDVHINKLGIIGDEQADEKHHGGDDKAICLYPFEHYAYWENRLNKKLDICSFGENITIEGLKEDSLYIGDTLKIGEIILEISQPRQPCYKLAYFYNTPELPIWVQETGYTGYYARVLKEGTINSNDKVSIIERDPLKISIEFANQIMHHDKKNTEAIRKILEVKALSKSWRASFEKMLSGSSIDINARVKG
ncbi:MAG: MOSC domain-containing protein [Sebaldella sp.]|nr:MOSC domain-containing protein [Sebaldella sp.]